MNEARLLRLLEVVQRELGAADARVEIGGREPEGEDVLFLELPRGWRVVAQFPAPPEDRAGLLERLAALLDAFPFAVDRPSEMPAALSAVAATRRLDDELEALAVRSGAAVAVVVDDKSPVLWGTSTSREGHLDVDTALGTASQMRRARRRGFDVDEMLGVDESELPAALGRVLREEPARRMARMVGDLRAAHRGNDDRVKADFLACLAIAAARREHDEDGARITPTDDRFVVRSFATIYVVALGFEGQVNQLRSEGALAHGLPVIERLVLALPPVDPPPGGARVLQFPRR